jgi:hypothetical protein
MAAAEGVVAVLGLEEFLGELLGTTPVWAVEISQSRLYVTGWGCGRLWKKEVGIQLTSAMGGWSVS